MEILVVLLIIGILTNLALPRLLPAITRAKTLEAKIQLNHLYTLQRSFFFEHSRYAETPAQLGFEPEKLVTNGGNANYSVVIVKASAAGFLAEARAAVDFDDDGVMNTWTINEEKVLTEKIPD